MTLDRLLAAVTALVRSILGEQLPGLYRYRFVRTVGDRVELQSVKKGVWPDLVAIEVGALPSGSWVDLAPGAVVLVAFEDADPKGAPIVVAGPPKGREGHVPVALHLDASNTVRVGASASHVDLGGASAAVHRVGDLGGGGVFSAAPPPATLLYVGPDGSSWAITLAAGMVPVTGTIALISGSAAGKIVTKAEEGSPEVKA